MKSHHQLEKNERRKLPAVQPSGSGNSSKSQKFSLTLDLKQTPSNWHLPMKSSDEIFGGCGARSVVGRLDQSKTSASSRANDEFSTIVLTSPDVEMVKLSTPDLDNYLLRLQQELSSECNWSTSGMENLCIETTEAIGGIEVVPNEGWNKPHPPGNIFQPSEMVTTERRFNSFDSGFSDVSVKTEIESDDLEVSQDDQRWLPHAYEQQVISGRAKATTSATPRGIQTQGTSKGYWTFQAATKGEFHLNELQLADPGDGWMNGANIPDGQRDGQRCARFAPSRDPCVDGAKPQSSRERPPLWQEFSRRPLDSAAGPPCSDHSSSSSATSSSSSSSFDNRSATSQLLIPNINFEPQTLPTPPGRFEDQSFTSPSVPLGPRGANPSLAGVASSTAGSATTTIEERRRCFRRQNAQMKPDDSTADRLQFANRSRFDASRQNVIVGSVRDEWEDTFFNEEAMKLQRKRAKNRLAATRCRNKKLEKIERLRQGVDFLRSLNSDYGRRVGRLRQEVERLQRRVKSHVVMGCDLSPRLPSSDPSSSDLTTHALFLESRP